MKRRCSFCRGKFHGHCWTPGYANPHLALSVEICAACYAKEPHQDITHWHGWDIVHEAPDPLPILMGTLCIAACVIMIAMLCTGRI